MGFEDLRKRYAALTDEELLRLAVSEAADLRPEALALLRAELANRGGSAALQGAIDAQITGLAAHELSDLVRRFRMTPCPMCRLVERPLNAVAVARLRSNFLRSRYETAVLVGCPPCIANATKQAGEATEQVGLWILSPLGIYFYIKARRINKRAILATAVNEGTPELLEFVAKNRGVVALALAGSGPTSR